MITKYALTEGPIILSACLTTALATDMPKRRMTRFTPGNSGQPEDGLATAGSPNVMDQSNVFPEVLRLQFLLRSKFASCSATPKLTFFNRIVREMGATKVEFGDN